MSNNKQKKLFFNIYFKKYKEDCINCCDLEYNNIYCYCNNSLDNYYITMRENNLLIY